MLRRAFALLAIVAGCKDPPRPKIAAPDASVVTSATTPPKPTTSAPTATTTVATPIGDAGPLACKVISPPSKLAQSGAYALVARRGLVEVFCQDSGSVGLVGSVALDATSDPHTKIAAAAQCGSLSPAVAGAYLFAANRAGLIQQWSVVDGNAEAVAASRPGGALAAAMIGGHPTVAFIVDGTSSEGVVTQAFVASVADKIPKRISEDGVGATSVALASRGESAIAVYVDARRGMSPAHARNVTYSGKLVPGKDEVLFVGGSAETYTHVGLAVRDKTAFALLPVAHDLAFGLAITKIDDEPKADAPTTWSDYPNGIDPAPIAATTDDSAHVTIALVRPSAPKYGASRVLELGEIDAAGAFRAYGIVPTNGNPRSVAITSDAAGGVVLAYTDAGGGWVERLKCAP